MSDDKTKTGAADRRQVAKGEDYEVEYFAKTHGISIAEAKSLIERIGNDRAKLDEAAKQLK
ncbi:MAG TPA: DUF3606 domain-containing protein [Aliidongia sp.]|uniref:DUF3606 domain-containing protein n=1 Tax=Aliidongia sp. TaxID=1914230 RepID=UPI002DDD151A|nr:DUF3606 domain-containing protein [Aliidongia sp.]HEV2674345.1 DUF3606 domain-containing protein [Aliidongia sp.]